MIVDPRAIVFTKDEPGPALRISNDVLPMDLTKADGIDAGVSGAPGERSVPEVA